MAKKYFVPPSEAAAFIKQFLSDYIVTVYQAMLADGSIICVTRTIPKLTADAFLRFVN